MIPIYRFSTIIEFKKKNSKVFEITRELSSQLNLTEVLQYFIFYNNRKALLFKILQSLNLHKPHKKKIPNQNIEKHQNHLRLPNHSYN